MSVTDLIRSARSHATALRMLYNNKAHQRANLMLDLAAAESWREEAQRWLE